MAPKLFAKLFVRDNGAFYRALFVEGFDPNTHKPTKILVALNNTRTGMNIPENTRTWRHFVRGKHFTLANE